MNLPTIEITQPELPATLPTEHQKLMNLFYGHWQTLSAEVRKNKTTSLREASAEFRRIQMRVEAVEKEVLMKPSTAAGAWRLLAVGRLRFIGLP